MKQQTWDEWWDPKRRQRALDWFLRFLRIERPDLLLTLREELLPLYEPGMVLAANAEIVEITRRWATRFGIPLLELDAPDIREYDGTRLLGRIDGTLDGWARENANLGGDLGPLRWSHERTDEEYETALQIGWRREDFVFTTEQEVEKPDIATNRIFSQFKKRLEEAKLAELQRHAITGSVVGIAQGWEVVLREHELRNLEWLARKQAHQLSYPALKKICKQHFSEETFRSGVNSAADLIGLPRHRIFKGRLGRPPTS